MLNAYLDGRTSLTGIIVKIVFLGIVDALAVFGLFLLADANAWTGFALVAAATIVINWVYLSSRTIPLKYLVPGTIFLLLFQIYPVAYNGYIAFTNYGDGHILSQEAATQRILSVNQRVPEDAERYSTVVLSNGSDEAEAPAESSDIALLLTGEDDVQYLGTFEGLRELEPGEVTGEGQDLRVGDYAPLTLLEANERSAELVGAFTVPLDDGAIQLQTFTVAARTVSDLTYDADAEVIVRDDGTEFTPVEGYWTSDDGETLTPGFRAFIGFDNFAAVLGNEDIRGEFIGVLIWTIVFALMSVITTFILGLGLAMALDDDRVRGKKIYRSLLIIPYALPSFMTALIWRGLLNQDFGFVNQLLGADIPWLTSRAFNGLLPRASTLLVNLWLGFPYMLLVCTGALQAIPGELKEAAKVDGASGFRAFRSVTLPLLLVTVGPLLIASFAFNFNNFNTIFLLTGGDPPIRGAATPVGYTDILISYAYRLAFGGSGGVDYGLAAAVSVFIFMAVAVITTISFRRTRVLEEIN
ncbi:MAG TPA: ABC transporter permease subunit [Nitriliruptoraceae bacterium]|nr:ABC transporter permease subunit [Nitriliruptoraceae bacterium]